MQVIHSIQEMWAFSDAIRQKGQSVGFVPTMGALHQGHLRLVEASTQACDVTVASIFVNPTQFGPGEDFDRYPRTFENDCAMLDDKGCSAVLTLNANEMYPEGFETWVDAEHLPNHLCGRSRPGHFRGVTTVVTKLFNIVKPHMAFFGWKDAQQALIIKKLVEDLNFDIEIKLVPTEREPDGLAMSSRNRYLSQEERKTALLIPKAIKIAREYFENGKTEAKLLKDMLYNLFEGRADTQVDYISLVNLRDLEEVNTITSETILAMAVKVGQTRLIDNHLFAEDV